MSINTTPFLHLPQWTGQEKPNFLAEMNGAWASIDRGYGDIKTDAATASGAASAAEASAANAVAKVNANAAQILSIQQEITQLEADFINAHYSTAIVGSMTVTNSNIQSVDYSIVYNEFLATLWLGVKIKPNLNGENITGEIAKITDNNIPFTYRQISGVGDVGIHTSGIKTGTAPTLFDATNSIIFRLENGNLSMEGGSAKFTTGVAVPGIDIFTTIPIFRLSNTREAVMDNCLFVQPCKPD